MKRFLTALLAVLMIALPLLSLATETAPIYEKYPEPIVSTSFWATANPKIPTRRMI